MQGYFITLEGGEGAGKTSTLQRLEQSLTQMGFQVVVTREPGGIHIAEKIREIILNKDHTKMDAKTEALLYAAARRQHLVEKILPALADGKIVLCDRFIDSSLAYQGYARGLGIDEVLAINEFAIDEHMPSLTLFFELSPEKGLQRIEQNQSREKNRLDLEHIHFHRLVYEGYQLLRERFPDRIKIINADQEIRKVAADALQQILSHVNNE